MAQNIGYKYTKKDDDSDYDFYVYAQGEGEDNNYGKKVKIPDYPSEYYGF